MFTQSTTANPMFTLTRGMEFARRYGMTMHPASMKELCAAVVNGESTLPTMDYSAVTVKKSAYSAMYPEGLYSAAAASTLKSMLAKMSGDTPWA